MRIVKKVLFFSLISLILLYIILIVGKVFLVVNEKPKKSDVIIVLSGGEERLEKGVYLFNLGYADYLMLSRANEPGITAKQAVELGVPNNNLILDEEATSTYTTALNAIEVMENYHFESAIIVSSDYHMRRTQLTFERVFKDSNVELTYVASQIKKKSLFLDEWDIRITSSELLKLVGYSLRMYEFIDL